MMGHSGVSSALIRGRSCVAAFIWINQKFLQVANVENSQGQYVERD